MSPLAEESAHPVACLYCSVACLYLLDEFLWKMMKHSGILAGLILAAFLPQGSSSKILVTEYEDQVFVTCNTSIVHLEGTAEVWFAKNKTLNLGKGILDPRGVYMCNGTEKLAKEEFTLQVYYRTIPWDEGRNGSNKVITISLKLCQNCVELDSATMAGVIITDLIATLLLALGVYCFAGHETGRLSGVSHIQALLRNEQLYQPLRDRDDAQYSHLGGNWSRNK
ncbi:hypothetical protein STEG23_003874 [Scotinomys teguina]